MKWLKEVYDLFVDDPKLSLLVFVALAVAVIVARAGAKTAAGLAIFLIVAASLWFSTRHD
ncbi:MAG: hypothetical protein C7B45_07200 [Sulfobacillus acidophilus]|uniref:Uncharacterized protein n=1 Tax=Sulfobacillus acidophilus TaxID=53633 RepID=A0A2T2WJ73_9FIRM|nr:MAG: hypothetical protein C7B45_07200 [Sulfobacillus acidophilus]